MITDLIVYLSVGFAAVFAIAQIGFLLAHPRPFVSPLEVLVVRQIAAVSIAAAILGGGALIGFAIARNHLASGREAMVLGAVAAIPVVLVANSVALSIGLEAAIGVAVLIAAAVAYLGGGGLRSRTSHV